MKRVKKSIAEKLSHGTSSKNVSALIKQMQTPFHKKLPIDCQVDCIVLCLDAIYNLLEIYGLCITYRKNKKRFEQKQRRRRKLKATI